MTILTTENAALPTLFTPPKVNPSAQGLWPSVAWTDEAGAPRWLVAGTQFESARTGNYSGELASGVWDADWCSEPGSGDVALKTGVRGDDPAPFAPITTWAYDECDLRPESRADVLARVAQVHRMREPVMLARAFGARLLADAGVPELADDLVEAIAVAECLFADANVVGAVHCSPWLRAHLVAHVLVSRTGVGGWATPGGHAVIFDAGYRAAFGDGLLVCTSSPVFGWRAPVVVRDQVDVEVNRYFAVAERSVVVGYEQALGSVSLSGSA